MKPMYEITEFQIRMRDVSNSMLNTAVSMLSCNGKLVPWYEDHRIMDRPLTEDEKTEMADTTARKLGPLYNLVGLREKLGPPNVWCWDYKTGMSKKKDRLYPGLLDGHTLICAEYFVPEGAYEMMHKSAKEKGHPLGKFKWKIPKTFEEAREVLA